MDDDVCYAEASRRAVAAAEPYRPARLAPAYLSYFAAVRRGAVSRPSASPGQS
jgi:hypothetical protein